ncbi:Acg family FMN-binding oxidoreductase [Streptomyces sp. NPDC127098]|uniref:Acg family FMN-binding oxidoreductase n=1 Tax=Streptomyces sp. NPDC127098 TaxID=3347137 RepID=UPI0036582781
MAPTAGLDAATVERLVSAATRAPSIHNTQPWSFRLAPDRDTLLVRAVPSRTLQETDPTGRALHVSTGTALYNLRVAAAHFGRGTAVRLLPDPHEPGLLAAVRVTDDRDGRGEKDLYDEVWRRHSSRFPFENRPLPRGVVDDLVAAARVEDVALYLPDADEVTRLLRLTAEGEWRNAHEPGRREESREWVREAGSYGIGPGQLGPGDQGGNVPVRDFAGLAPALPTRVFERNPVIGVLATTHDRRTDWLRAGEALEHVLLVATGHEVRASLLHQALEWPDLRAALHGPDRPPEHVQMLIRLGYGPPGQPSPRRPASEITGAEPRTPW